MPRDGSIGAATAPERARTGTAQRVLFLLGVLMLALLPVLLNPLGIAGDYPNHLARVHVEQELARSAALAEHFTLDWGIYPDLAMDLFMGPLMPLIGPYAAGAAFNALALATLPVGVALLSLAVTGRVSLLPAASVLLIYGAPVTWGFMNFVFATGAAVILFAGWLHMRPGWGRVGVFVPLTLALFFSHILGFLLFCFLVLAFETGRFLDGQRGPLRRFAADLLLRDALVTALPLLLFAVSFPARAAGLETEITDPGGLVDRIQALVSPFDYQGGPDTFVVFAGFYAGLFVAFRRGWITLAPSMRPVVLAALILVLAMPEAFLGISLLDIRYGAIPAAVILGGASFTPAGRPWRRHLLAGAALLFAVHQAALHTEMSALDRQQQQMRAAMGELARGSRVLIGASVAPEGSPPLVRTPASIVRSLMHTPALAVIEVDGYVPTLFPNTSPVGVSGTAAPIHQPQAWPLSAEGLLAGQRLPPREAQPSPHGNAAYFHGWPRRFDALLWLSPDGVPAPQSPHLTETARGEGFILYAISPGSRDGGSGAARAGRR